MERIFLSTYSRYEKALSNRMRSSNTDATPLSLFIRNKIARHEANIHGLAPVAACRACKGRDFIVGDLHGCVGYLDTLMRHVGFDTSTDRLFSVGDLADRGPDSPGSLELLKQPWFYPVMGNHDAMLLAVLMEYAGLWPKLSAVDQARAEVYASAFFGNGGNWLDILFAR